MFMGIQIDKNTFSQLIDLREECRNFVEQKDFKNADRVLVQAQGVLNSYKRELEKKTLRVCWLSRPIYDICVINPNGAKAEEIFNKIYDISLYNQRQNSPDDNSLFVKDIKARLKDCDDRHNQLLKKYREAFSEKTPLLSEKK